MNHFVNSSRETLLKYRFILANIILISLMVGMITYTFQKAIDIFATDWNGGYLPFLGFIISLISLNSHRKTRDIAFLSKERLARNISEWVVILLALKIVIYLFNDPSQLLRDFQLWSENFFKYFFTRDYIAAIVISLLSWGIAMLLGQPIGQLEEDKALMDQEKLGYTFNNRTNARKALISTVFLLGGLQLFLTAIIRSDISLPGFQTNPSYSLVLAMISYFLFGFLLLALNQYNLQKARWYLSEVIVADSVPHRWLIYCIILISLVTLVALLLPTKYIIGVFPAIRFLWNILVYIFNWLNALIFLPLLAFLRIFDKEGTAPDDPTEQIFQQNAPIFDQTQVPTINQDIAWWGIVKSVFFWVFLILLVFITLKYYLGQKKAWHDFVSRIHFFDWSKNVWKTFKEWAKALTNKGIKTFEEGTKAIQKIFTRAKKGVRGSSNYIQQLPIRLSIISAYIDFRTWLNSFGFPVSKSLTPIESRDLIIARYPQSIKLMRTITTLFVDARYTVRELTKANSAQMQKAISQLKSQLSDNQK